MRVLAAIASVGARTAIGLDAMQTGFLARAGAVGIREGAILDQYDEPIRFCHTGMHDPYRTGWERALELALPPLDECLGGCLEQLRPDRLEVVLCLDEFLGAAGFGATSDAQLLVNQFDQELYRRFQQRVPLQTANHGPAAAGIALPEPLARLENGQIDAILLGGIHSDYDLVRIRELDAAGRLFTPDNLDALIPGEAAAFALLTTPRLARQFGWPVRAQLHSLGSAHEKARPDNDESAFEAGGLTLAVRQATEELRAEGRRLGWQLNDLSFELLRAHEWQAVSVRTKDLYTETQRAESPGHRLGYLGAATFPVHLALAAEAWRRGYAPDSLAISFAGSDAGARVAAVLGAP